MHLLRMSPLATRTLSAFGLTLLAACSAPAEDDTRATEDSVIIGDNDLLPVSADGANVPARYRPLLDAFGRLLIPGSTPGSYALCTATHIGNGVVVTAGHCFGAPGTRANNQPCAGTKVEFGSRTGKSPTLVSSCTQIAAMETNDTRDYAILRVSPIPSAAVGIDLGSPAPGTPLTIFSHPGGRPLEWSRTCSLMTQGGDHFGYQCDTQGGSSGAAVLRDDTLRVTGIHWGGGGSQNSATYLGKTATDALASAGGGATGVLHPYLATDKCIDVDAWSTANGADIISWSCHGGANQQWSFVDGTLRVYGTKCLDVEAGVDVNGRRVQTWDCQAGNGNQQWVAAGDHYQWAGHNKCLDLKDGNTAAGARFQIWDCDAGNPNQRFTR